MSSPIRAAWFLAVWAAGLLGLGAISDARADPAISLVPNEGSCDNGLHFTVAGTNYPPGTPVAVLLGRSPRGQLAVWANSVVDSSGEVVFVVDVPMVICKSMTGDDGRMRVVVGPGRLPSGPFADIPNREASIRTSPAVPGAPGTGTGTSPGDRDDLHAWMLGTILMTAAAALWVAEPRRRR